ncbi:MAG: DUF4112 domain-containing protein [Sphingomonadales bacterium]|nr:MAG: DUF4112 domain-containing protein [Sphingomonadales bacterium]
MATGLGRDLPLGRDAGAVRRRIEGMEKLLERGFTIPGTNQKFGLDVILDLIPVGGGFIAAAMGLYMVMEARNLNMPKSAIARMMGNVGFDWLLGLVPVVGVIPDLFFRSNSRNLRIIRKHLDKHHPSTATIDQP